jgi:hypothetical protein
MNRVYYEQSGGDGKNDKNLFSWNTLAALLNLSGGNLLSLFYTILALSGLAGALFMIFRVINMPAISSFEMIILFVVSCIPISIMGAGFYGLSQISERKRNSEHRTVRHMR